MNKLRRLSVVFATSLIVFQLNASPAQAQTSSWSGVCVGSSDNTVATIQGLQCLLANILATFLTLVGLVAFIMLIVSAFRILLSGGNAQNVEKAQKSITYAVVGLIVALSAFVILNLVSQFTGVETILKFNIPSSDTQWAL
ncbi:MAG TPA: hypothetical protein VGA89_03320 [Patescibacteria group bacterium]|jgi:hypothetical protein